MPDMEADVPSQRRLIAMVQAVASSGRGPSRTAVLTAVARELHRREHPMVFDDDLAFGLAGPEAPALIDRLQSTLSGSSVMGFSRWVAARSRYTEELVDRAVERGFGQYVILGAGLDSFAYRRGDLVGRLQIFEVDHPASQSWKRGQLDALGIQIPTNTTFASVDFERQTLRDGLEQAGFEFGQLAVFSWIGVTMYLTSEAISATLATIGQCSPGSELVLTYNQPAGILDAFSLQVTDAFIPIATGMGEPFLSLFLPDEIEAVVRTHGFDDISHFGAQEARIAYFDGHDDLEIAGAQRLLMAKIGQSV